MTIGELIVKLALDSSDLDKKAPASAKKIKDLEEQTTKQGKSLTKMTGVAKDGSVALGVLATAVGSALAAFGGSEVIKAFTLGMIQSAAAVGRFAANLGVSTSAVTAWGNMAQEIGGKAGDIQSAFELLTKAQSSLQMTGESALIPFFNTLGVSMSNSAGHAKSANELFMDAADGLKRLAANTSRPNAVEFAKSMGFNDTSINLMLESRQALQASLDAQKAYGDQVAKFQPDAIAMQKAIADLKQQFTLFGLTLLQKVTPVLEKLLGWLKSVTDWAIAHKDVVGDFAIAAAAGLGALSLAVGGLTAAFGLLTLATMAADVAASPFIAAIAAMAVPVAATVAGVAAFSAALLVLIDDYKKWKSGSGGSFFDWSSIEPGVQAMKKSFQDLKAIGKDALGVLYYEAAATWRAIHGDFKGARAAQSMSDQYAKGIGSHILNDASKEVAVWSATRANLKANGGKPTGNFEDDPIGRETLPQAIARVEGFNAKGAKQNRPQRDHNPGDIRYGKFAVAHGGIGNDGGYAVFPDDETGFKALYALLKTPGYANLTVDQAIARWAPPTENNTKAYQASVSKMTGLAGNTSVMPALAGMTGARLSPTSNDNSTQVTNTANVAQINIHTQATDAKGIAKEIGNGMNFIFPQYANAGLS